MTYALPTPTLTATIVDGAVQVSAPTRSTTDVAGPQLAPAPRPRRSYSILPRRPAGASQRRSSRETAAAFLEAYRKRTGERA